MENFDEDNYVIINNTLMLIKPQIAIFKAFYPIAQAIDLNGKVMSIEIFENDIKPSSEYLINKFQKELHKRMKLNEIRAYGIACDVITKRDSESMETNAIAIKIKHKNSKTINIFYTAYKLPKHTGIDIIDSWVVKE